MKQFHLDPRTLESDAEDRTEWNPLVSAGAFAFASVHDAAEVARRDRRHNPPSNGAHQCGEYGRRCASLAGLGSHLRAHLRRRVADDVRVVGEEDVVIETDGHP